MDSRFTIKPRPMRSPTDFEEAAADWMRAWGQRSVTRTHAGRDGGIDVESVKAVAQVKAWMVPVGSPEIQQLKGAAHDGRTPLFFSLTDYTLAAIQFAEQAGVALFRFSGYNGEVEPANIWAARFLTERCLLSGGPVEDFGNNPICVLVHEKLEYVVAHPFSFCTVSVKTAAYRYVQAASGDGGVVQLESVGKADAHEPLTRVEMLKLQESRVARVPQKR